MNQQKIKVRDRNGDYNNWIVYGETKNTYKIYAECNKSYIAEIYRFRIYSFIDELYTDEIKCPYPLMSKEYMRAEFCEIWAKCDEC